MRIIWSRSTHASADLFTALKSTAEEPDPAVAAAVGAEDAALQGSINQARSPGDPVRASHRAANRSARLHSQAAVDFVQRLPGVTERNHRGLLAGISTLSVRAHLCALCAPAVKPTPLYCGRISELCRPRSSAGCLATATKGA